MNRSKQIAVLALMHVLVLAGCAVGPPKDIGGPVDAPQPERPARQPDSGDPSPQEPGEPGSEAARDDDFDKLSPGLQREFGENPFAPTISLTSSCNPDYDDSMDAPKPLTVSEVIVNFGERMPSFRDIAPESFELVRRKSDIERFYAVWAHRGNDREPDVVQKEDVLHFARNDKVVHVEANCRYPQPIVHSSTAYATGAGGANGCPRNLATCPVIPGGPFPPDDLFFEKNSLWGLESIGIHDPWRMDVIQSNKLIAVIDTGVNYDHPEFRRIIWENAAERAGIAGTDDDANGYTDDVHGYAFADDCDPADPVNTNCKPLPGTGHGTFAASIIGARGDNGNEANSHTLGVAWKSRIAAIRVGTKDDGFDNAQIANAIGYARTIGARIINISLTTNLTRREMLAQGIFQHWPGICCNNSYTMSDQIRKTPNALFVAASGRNYPKYPAAFPHENIMSVSGIMRHHCSERHAQPDASAKHPTGVDISAPAVQICGIDGDQFALSTGVSWAAPHVAGAAALAWSTPYARLWKPEQIKALLIRTARWSPHLIGWSVSEGALDVGFLSGWRWNVRHIIEMERRRNSEQ